RRRRESLPHGQTRFTSDVPRAVRLGLAVLDDAVLVHELLERRRIMLADRVVEPVHHPLQLLVRHLRAHVRACARARSAWYRASSSATAFAPRGRASIRSL